MYTNPMLRLPFLILLCSAALSSAEPKKIVMRAAGDTSSRDLETVPNVRIVIAKTPTYFAREVVDADAVLGGIAPDQFKTAKKLK